jgi:hypothetical protein
LFALFLLQRMPKRRPKQRSGPDPGQRTLEHYGLVAEPPGSAARRELERLRAQAPPEEDTPLSGALRRWEALPTAERYEAVRAEARLASVRGKTADEYRALLNEVASVTNKDDILEVDPPALLEFFIYALRRRRHKLKPTTLRKYKSAWRYFQNALGKPVESAESKDLDAILNHLLFLYWETHKSTRGVLTRNRVLDICAFIRSHPRFGRQATLYQAAFLTLMLSGKRVGVLRSIHAYNVEDLEEHEGLSIVCGKVKLKKSQQLRLNLPSSEVIDVFEILVTDPTSRNAVGLITSLVRAAAQRNDSHVFAGFSEELANEIIQEWARDRGLDEEDMEWVIHCIRHGAIQAKDREVRAEVGRRAGAFADHANGVVPVYLVPEQTRVSAVQTGARSKRTRE